MNLLDRLKQAEADRTVPEFYVASDKHFDAQDTLRELLYDHAADLIRLATAVERYRRAHFSDPPNPDEYGDAGAEMFEAVRPFVEDTPSEEDAR